MKRSLRYAVWLVVLALVAAAVAFFIRPSAVQVETATIERRRIDTSVESEAKTRIHDRYVVSAPVAGRLSRFALEEGDAVRAGAVIASIDPLPQEAAVNEALAKLRELDAQIAGVETLRPKSETLAQAQTRIAQSKASAASASARVRAATVAFDHANREAARQTKLEEQGYASRLIREQAELAQRLRARDLEIARTDAAAANAQVAIDTAAAAEIEKKVRDPDYLRGVYQAQANGIRAQLKQLEDQRRRTAIVSPVGGAVLRVMQKSEAYVAAGAPIVELGNRKTLEIVADVLSEDAVNVHPGDRVEVTSGTGTARVRGVVRRIEPSGYTKISALGIEEQRVNVLIDIVDPPPALGDGYRLNVRIITYSADALAIPIAALFRCETAWCAYVVRDGRAHRVSVDVGRFGAEDAELLRGARAGDVVILRPPESLREGSRVH